MALALDGLSISSPRDPQDDMIQGACPVAKCSSLGLVPGLFS